MSRSVFLVGKYLEQHEKGAVWEFQGVFTSEQKADEACVGPEYFYGPATLDKAIPDETVAWNGCVYPRSRN